MRHSLTDILNSSYREAGISISRPMGPIGVKCLRARIMLLTGWCSLFSWFALHSISFECLISKRGVTYIQRSTDIVIALIGVSIVFLEVAKKIAADLVNSSRVRPDMVRMTSIPPTFLICGETTRNRTSGRSNGATLGKDAAIAGCMVVPM